MPFMPRHQMMQRERHLVGVGGAPGNDPLELHQIVGDGADFYQFCLNCLGIAHIKISMAYSEAPEGFGAGRSSGRI